MELIRLINTKLKDFDKLQLANSMGYNNPSKCLKRLSGLCSATSLQEWFKISHYDFVHSNESFLIKLCGLLSIDEKEYLEYIKNAKRILKDLALMPHPYIFVDTHFKRTSESIFILCITQGQRKLMIAKEDVYHSTDEGLSFASQIVADHYKETKGVIGIWGKIQEYVYHVNNKSFVFDTNGQLVCKKDDVPEQSASLYVGGRKLPL